MEDGYVNIPDANSITSGTVTTTTGKRWNFCPNCGTKLEVEWKHCPGCGLVIVETVSAPFVIWPTIGYLPPWYPPMPYAYPNTATPLLPPYAIYCGTADSIMDARC